MKKQLVFIFAALLLLGIGMTLFTYEARLRYRTGSSTRCEVFQKFKNMYVSGIVRAKYKDVGNHNVETLDLVDGIGRVENYYFNADRSGFFQFVNVGDSIFKEKQSAKMTILRNGKRYQFESDYGCK